MSTPSGQPGITVAILGLGRMGAAMARTLRRTGFDVIVYNRTRSTAEKVAVDVGATIADTAEEAVSAASVVISILADDAAVTEVLTAASAGMKPGTVVLEMSTIDPDTLATVRPTIEAAGCTLLDAPVSGSVSLVEAGELTIMVGGEGEALELARPVLQALAARIFHLGGQGTGAVMKLAVNSILHALNVAVSEALVLAEKAGVDRAEAYEVFAASAAGAPYLHYKRDAFENPETVDVAFKLALVLKDLDLIQGLAHRVGASLDQGAATREIVGRAVDSGFADDDLSAVASFLRAR